MKLDVRQVGNVAVVGLTGRITLGEGDVVLRERLTGLLRDDQPQILLNLEGVSYMDSSGIAELVASYKRAQEQDGAVKLLRPSARIADLLRATGLDKVFETYRDEAEALASFAGGGAQKQATPLRAPASEAAPRLVPQAFRVRTR